MSKALVIGVTVLVLSAASASAQVYLTSDYGYAAPVADLAAPAYGYAAATYVAPGPVYAVPPAYAAPVYAAPPVYAVPAPLYGYYAAPYGYAPGSREWVIERGDSDSAGTPALEDSKTTSKSLVVVSTLLVGGASLAVGQNSHATGGWRYGQQPRSAKLCSSYSGSNCSSSRDTAPQNVHDVSKPHP